VLWVVARTTPGSTPEPRVPAGLDDLCVALSPLLASGDAKAIVGASSVVALERLRLYSICEEYDSLFLRYCRAETRGVSVAGEVSPAEPKQAHERGHRADGDHRDRGGYGNGFGGDGRDVVER
jgi:hypothetical protein